MIPADVASRIRLVNDLVTQPAAPAQKIADALSEFVPGQRMMATIQALLPNGTYRAMIAQQREITLALPFAAKPGDALELEVVDTQGKLALAIAEGNKQAAEGKDSASVATRLTVTGRLIAELLAGMDKEGGKRPQPAPLNNAQPVVERFPQNAADLVPALKMALARSGMFYESHQAQWAQGRASLETLLQEPQGRLSPAVHILTQQPSTRQAASQPQNTLMAGQSAAGTPNAQATSQAAAGGAATNAHAATTQPALSASTAEQAARGDAQAQAAARNASPTPNAALAETGVTRVSMNRIIAAELAPLVQQQLEALATSSYVWQGQIWPGQNMDWEIIEEDARRENRGENTAANWTTHLRLTLPTLGGLDATLRLSNGKEIEITLRAENAAARTRLNAANGPLQRQFETAGLKLKSLAITRHARPEPGTKA
jgi:hypothetical protein